MAETTARGRIFISYRREETAYPAGWLFDRLTDHFGRGQVFKDIDSIAPGDDFVDVLTDAVGSCDALLALIGSEWLTVTDDEGKRRLDNPADFVRLEIEAALARKVRVVPVLIGGAQMPRAEDLPESLAPLTRRHALELSPSHFEFETTRLLRVLDERLATPIEGVGVTTGVIAAKPIAPEPPAPPSPPAPPPPVAPRPEPPTPRPDTVPLGVTICVLVGAALLGVGVFAHWDRYHDAGRSWLDLQFGDTADVHHGGFFTAPSALMLFLGALAALALAYRPATRPLGAGLLIGFGLAGILKYLGVLSVVRGNPDPRAHAGFVFIAVLAGAVLVVVAGVLLARMDGRSDGASPLALVATLLVAAAVLIVAGSAIPFNNGGDSEVKRTIMWDERWQSLDPLLVGALALAALALFRSGRRLLAAGVLIAFGLESSLLWLRYLGVPVIESSSVGSFGAGAAAGLLGGLLILAAGLLLWRREASSGA